MPSVGLLQHVKNSLRGYASRVVATFHIPRFMLPPADPDEFSLLYSSIVLYQDGGKSRVASFVNKNT